jgi:hypothetical protein
VHVSDEIDLIVVEGLQESPVPVGIFGLQARNDIWDRGVVADLATQAPGALQDKAGISPGLVGMTESDRTESDRKGQM